MDKWQTAGTRFERGFSSGAGGNQTVREERAQLQARVASLDTALKLQNAHRKEKLAVVAQAKQEFREAFGALAADALRNNNSSFLEQAKSALGSFNRSARRSRPAKPRLRFGCSYPRKARDFDKQVRKLQDARNLAYAN